MRFLILSVLGCLILLNCVAAICAEIHDAARNGEGARVMNLLVKDPSLIRLRDDNGYTPLHLAAKNGHNGLTKQLVESGAEIDARAKDGSTPLHLAAAAGHRATAEVLVDAMSDVNALDEQGRTPLRLAEDNGHEEMAAMLREHGAASK